MERSAMHFGHLQYLPIAPLFFLLLVGLFAVLVLFVEVGILQYAYTRLGVSSRAALLLLFGSLLGSYINIPVAQFPEQNVVVGQEVTYFGMEYIMPVLADWPGTIVAVNVGGAVIPTILSLYLLVQNRLWLAGLIATAIVAAICYQMATPVQGVGVTLPIFTPPIAAALVAIVISIFARQNAAPLAYIAGSLGTLIGADLLNLPRIPDLGAPVASIGGAGTFDGIFITGIMAVLLASLSTGWRRAA
jgi:uncharacterized membrane protein